LALTNLSSQQPKEPSFAQTQSLGLNLPFSDLNHKVRFPIVFSINKFVELLSNPLCDFLGVVNAMSVPFPVGLTERDS